MCAHRNVEPDEAVSPITRAFVWLGAGESPELGRRDERSPHIIAGVVVLIVAALAWLVAALALSESTTWPPAAVVAATGVFGVLVGAVSRAIAAGPIRSRPGILARGAVAVAIGVVAGELAAVVLLSGAIDRVLDERAAQRAESAPAVARASDELQRTREARAGLDGAVDRALQQREEALVVARCEFNPRPDCPQVFITGVPGPGAEARTADEFLADAQRELDNALAERNTRGAELDARMADGEQALAQAHRAAASERDSGLGARWVAMNAETLAHPAALALRLIAIGFFGLLSMLPLILKLWRGETTQDRAAAADTERDRAEVQADTAIAVKRAEVRAAVENLWAEQQLASTRLAVEAQLEIDREQQRCRVIEARGPVVQARSERVVDDIYLPIAAEAEAASLAAAPDADEESVTEAENLPVPVEEPAPAEPAEQTGRPLIAVIPDATMAAARWIRPFVPPIIVSAIDTSTKPLRGVRQVLEETEEIQFWLKRTRKVSVEYEETDGPAESPGAPADERNWVRSSTPRPSGRDHSGLTASTQRAALRTTERGGRHELPP